VRLSARKVQRSKGNEVVRFEVSDSGIGISLEAQQRIFESLEQADDTISRRFGGTGLGLSLCRHLVELMQGTISCTANWARAVFRGGDSLPECLQESDGVVPELTAPLLQGCVISLQCETPGLRNMLSAFLRLWGAQLHHNAPQSPIDFQVIAQDCTAGVGPEHAERAGVPAVVMVADVARIPGNVDKRLYVSAFDWRDWMRTLTARPVRVR
jgi:two-component system capsular synthesis sensor histidine kinase RcsC